MNSSRSQGEVALGTASIPPAEAAPSQPVPAVQTPPAQSRAQDAPASPDAVSVGIDCDEMDQRGYPQGDCDVRDVAGPSGLASFVMRDQDVHPPLVKPPSPISISSSSGSITAGYDWDGSSNSGDSAQVGSLSSSFHLADSDREMEDLPCDRTPLLNLPDNVTYSQLCIRTQELIASKLREISSRTVSKMRALVDSVNRQRSLQTTVASVSTTIDTTDVAAAFLPVAPLYPDSVSAIQFSYDMIQTLYDTSGTKAAVEREIKYTSTRLLGRRKDPSDPYKLNLPRSIHQAERLLDVPHHTRYEINTCSTPNCLYWWWSLPDADNHKRSCTNPSCSTCICPLCKAPRYTRDTTSNSASWSPAQRAWFFPDVFQSFFLDPEWVSDVTRTRVSRSSWYHQSPECTRVVNAISKCNGKCDNLFFFELAADGVPLLPHHSTTVYMLRSRDTSSHLDGKNKNIHPVLVVPGPKTPDCGFDVFTALILNLFAMFGPCHTPDSAHKLTVFAPRKAVHVPTPAGQYTSSSDHDCSDTEDVQHIGGDMVVIPVVPILTGLVADYPMRSKLTHWYGPSGTHNGGWCMCTRGYQPDAADNEVLLDGYSQPIPQPYLRELEHGYIQNDTLRESKPAPRAMCGDSRLQLSTQDLIRLGDLATRAQQAILAYDKGDRLELGRKSFYTKGAAQLRLSQLGRSGSLPWANNFMMRYLHYIDSTSFVQVPTAHLFLHGLMKAFLGHFLSPPEEWKKSSIVFNAKQRSAVRNIWARLRYPTSSLGTLRNPIDYMKSFKMQDMSALLWTIALITHLASDEFNTLWFTLRHAVVHYMYRYNSTEHDMELGALAIREYAEGIEKLVANKKLPKTMLRPNLHIAFCRLPKQEKTLGPAARCTELWMERGLQDLTQHGDGGGREHPDVTMLKRGPLINRALGMAEVVYGVETWKPDEPRHEKDQTMRATTDPDQRRNVYPYLKGGVRRYTRLSAHTFPPRRHNPTTNTLCPPTSTDSDVNWNNVTFIAMQCLLNLAQKEDRWVDVYTACQQEGCDSVWRYCNLTVYQGCEFEDRAFSSLLAVHNRKKIGRSLASAFATMHPDLARECESDLPQSYVALGIPAVVDHYLRIEWTHPNNESDVLVTKHAVCCRLGHYINLIVGQPVWYVQDPIDFNWTQNGDIFDLHLLARPVIVLAPDRVTGPHASSCTRLWAILPFANSTLGMYYLRDVRNGSTEEEMQEVES